MQLEHSFTVPVPVAQAWEVLLDIEQIAPCMPGAVLDSVDGDDFTGRVKVKLGPISLTYKGKASFVKKDAATHTAVIDAAGKDQRGNGTAAATVTATLKDDGGSSTRVEVLTDLNITGKPAQFGRGVMVDVGNKLIGQFASCVEGKLSGSEDSTAAGGADNGAAVAAGTSSAGSAASVGPASADPVSADPASGGAAADPADPADADPEAAGTGGRHAAEGAVPRATDNGATADSGGATPAGSVATADGGGATPSGSVATAGGGPAAATRPRVVPAREPEPIDLLDIAGGSVLTRMGIPAAGLAAAVVILALIIRKIRS